MSTIVVLEPGYPATISDDQWLHDWLCGCFVVTGWDAQTHAAVAIFHACRDPGPHAAPMQRARERYVAIYQHPREMAELSSKRADEVIRALAEQELQDA